MELTEMADEAMRNALIGLALGGVSLLLLWVVIVVSIFRRR